MGPHMLDITLNQGLNEVMGPFSDPAKFHVEQVQMPLCLPMN